MGDLISLELYVTADGNDVTGDGSSILPFATIQKAVDSVPNIVDFPCRIHVGSGSFPGFRIDAKNVVKPKSSAGAYVAVLGTSGEYVPTQGPHASLVVSSLSSVTPLATASFVVSGSNWVPGELEGKFLVNETKNAPQRRIPIIANTADTIFFYCSSTYISSSDRVSIVEPKTVIDSALGLSLSTTTPSLVGVTDNFSGSEGNVLVRIIDCSNAEGSGISESPALLLSDMRLTVSGSTASRLRINTSKVLIRNIVTDGPGAGAHVGSLGSTVSISSWASLGSGYSYNAATSNGSDRVNLDLTFIRRSSAVGGLFGISDMIATDMYVKGCTAGATLQGSNHTYIRCAFDLCTTGIICNQGATYQSLGIARVALNGGFFNDCGTGIELKGPHWCQAKFWSGSGNTTVARVKHGARFGFRSSDYGPAGTTEFELDTQTTDCATVRTSTPPVVRESLWGSTVYVSDTNTTP